MAEAVEISTRNLEESEKRKTLFMGNLTHELKTPMTAISGYAQTLLSTKISRENQEAALLYIYEECGRLERLSKKMMKLLELEQDTELSFTDTPVEQLFEASAAACRVLLEEKQITLECSQKGEHFNMDVDLMTDVLINLIDNAVKASDAGGKILLRAYGDCIEVQDFGRGIPAEEQEKILEPFYMIDKSRSRQNGGAGLGLALVAVILKKHGVSLRIESSEGVGTRMILQFV
jgi:signal transduction histidine kinase